jgi:tetratricopeptide (TPR) repeat protein
VIYVDEANLKLSSSTGSLLELSAANALLRSALRLRPEDQTLLVVYQANDRYLKTMDEFVRGDWDLTILNMEAILAEDANYASGVGAQALFDALMERGRQSLALNDYETALPYFLRALEVAEVLPNNALVLLVAQTGYAHTLGMLDRSLEAVQAYQKGVNQAGIVELARKRSASMYDLLTNAQALADIGNYPGALIAYKDAFDKIGDLLDTVSTTTQDGDYLPYLARQHGSTTDLIMQFSALLSRRIGNGDMLTIPFLPTETIR